MPSRYGDLDRSQLAVLVPELLICGQLIDRSGMAWCISALGREEMAQIAIEEWMAASPIYTRRMQRALGYEGSEVATIFKGLQLDIGAPPQFMDFRYTVHDPWHGEFRLDHCGALMDVEPMGEAYVRAMCHDIEDPTFDATAVATNPKAQVRPIHRPPHCAWTVTIDEAHPPVTESSGCRELRRSRAAAIELDPIDPAGEGMSDYSGPLLSDIDFGAFSHSALVRIADEVALQGQLLNLGFRLAVTARLPAEEAREVCVKQLTGIAGVAAGRLHRALDLPAGVEGALEVLRVHPMLNPHGYVDAEVTDRLVVRRSAAHDDGGWVGLLGPGENRPLQAAVRAVDPHLDVEVTGSDTDWELCVVAREEAAPVAEEVAVARLSTGASFAFEPRRALPIVPV